MLILSKSSELSVKNRVEDPDPPILDPLDPDPHFLWIRTQGTFLGGKYGDIYIIDQTSQNLGYFYRFFLG